MREYGTITGIVVYGHKCFESLGSYDRSEKIIYACHYFNIMANTKTTWYVVH